ncbi:acid protease, partial [Heliocybe sulcata]
DYSEYTVPVILGNGQNLSLQVDTGSSDLWAASTSCSSCSSAGAKYNPSQATNTNVEFTINYLIGTVSGPIVWDTVQLGGYSIDGQAIAAATDVGNEPLSSQFDGVLGLALPANSVIANKIPVSLDSDRDGATVSSNLFSMTPTSQAPPARFFSLSLERPGSNRIPSLLGIGRHPESLVPDPSQITYSDLITTSSLGQLFWQASVKDVTVYVDGEAKTISIGRSHTGAAYPIAAVDSGVPYIITTSTIANGIYGAIGINPSSDGQYYVPCTTPLNMTITLDGQPPLPLHPLDLTGIPQKDATSPNCIGLIQAADSALMSDETVGDIILGVPFLRNMYTVLAYDAPSASGSFPSPSLASSMNKITPKLGVMPLTNASAALEEFHTVRVLNQPLASTTPQQTASDDGKKGLSVGLDVLIGLLSFFALCAALFGLRWVLTRRRFRNEQVEGGLDAKDAYALAALGPEGDAYGPSEDTLRTLRYETYKRNRRMHSAYSADSALTKVEEDDGKEVDRDPWDPRTSVPVDWRDTLVGEEGGAHKKNYSGSDSASGSGSPPTHQRNLSEGSNGDGPVTTPLLAHVRTSSQGSDGNGMDLGDRASMVGVGSGGRNSLRGRESMLSIGSMQDLERTTSRPYQPSPLRPRLVYTLSSSSTLQEPPAPS